MIVKALNLAAVALALSLVPALAVAEPITLKLSYFSSDRSHLYLSGAKPFVDAINKEGRGRVRIEPYFSGRLGSLPEQSRMVRDGVADIAYVILPYERAAFPDAAVIELPSLYKDATEATRVFAKLAASGVMRGFSDFFVIGVIASEPETIHSRPSLTSLAELRGKRIRINNDVEAGILEKLGGTPSFVPLNRTAEEISSGRIDGAMAPPVPMIEFGIGRVAPYHYLLHTSCVPQALLVNRKRFESLPADVQAMILNHSGDWFTDNYIRINEAATVLVMNQLEADPRRKVTVPSAADMKTVGAVFRSVVDGYAAMDPHNADLVKAARAAVASLRPVQ